MNELKLEQKQFLTENIQLSEETALEILTKFSKMERNRTLVPIDYAIQATVAELRELGVKLSDDTAQKMGDLLVKRMKEIAYS
jgi:hypothetical protein